MSKFLFAKVIAYIKIKLTIKIPVLPVLRVRISRSRRVGTLLMLVCLSLVAAIAVVPATAPTRRAEDGAGTLQLDDGRLAHGIRGRQEGRLLHRILQPRPKVRVFFPFQATWGQLLDGGLVVDELTPHGDHRGVEVGGVV